MFKSLLQVKNLLNLLPARLISKQVYILTLPITVIVTVFVIPLEINRPVEYLYWFIIGLLGHLVMLPFVAYGLSIKRLISQTLLVLAMGLVRGVSIGLLEPIFGFEDQFSIPLRAMTSMLFIFYTFQIITVFYDLKFGFKRQVSELLRQGVLNGYSLEIDSASAPDNELMVQIRNLQNKIRNTISSHPSTTNMEQIAKEVDIFVTEYIRPLSKSKWRDGNLELMKMGFFLVLKRSLSLAPLPVVEVYLLTLPLAIVNQGNRLELSDILVGQCIWLFSLVLIVKGINFILPAKDDSYFIQNISIILGSSLIIAPIIYYINNLDPADFITSSNIYFSQTLTSLMIALLLISSSVLSFFNNNKSQTLAYLKGELNNGKSKNYLESGRKMVSDRNYAEYLHSEVQSKLLGCKLLLLKAAESNFQIFSPEITNQILSKLDRLEVQPISPASAIPSRRIEELARSWVGIADISFDLPANLDDFGSDANMVCQLIEEGVINAIRHGKAKKIEVHGFFITGLINVVVHDDGSYVKNKKKDGLGSILFDTFAKDWDIKPDKEGTALRFSVETSSLNKIGKE